jgi:hypothetical protein
MLTFLLIVTGLVMVTPPPQPLVQVWVQPALPVLLPVVLVCETPPASAAVANGMMVKALETSRAAAIFNGLGDML